MRVLHLPWNISSQISLGVRALRGLSVESRGIVCSNDVIQDPRGLEVLTSLSRRRHPIRGTLHRWYNRRAILDAIRWADVVHWHFSWALPKAADVRLASRLGKARLVEFWGSDIRIPRIACVGNPYIVEMYRRQGIADDCVEQKSLATQRLFAAHGLACLIPGNELDEYVDRTLFSSLYRCRPAVAIDEYEPRYPRSDSTLPSLVHMPSSKAKKGTDAVMRAVEALEKTHRFEFRLVHGMQRSDALDIVAGCDIVLDQFVIGAEGFVSLEAMALGKPTVCYIKPSLLPKYPPELPIVNANQDNLADVLKDLLEDGARRHEIGRRGRAYVEKYHDSRQLAVQLVSIYEELLHKSRRNQPR